MALGRGVALWSASLLALAIFAATSAAQQYTISTFAGGVPPSTPTPATAASIGTPFSVKIDTAGNVYFTSDGCVFRLDTRGTLTRIAGTSRPGFSGDGGPAATASFSYPQGLAVDTAGNVYVADNGNNRVRKISTNGTISTIAGTGVYGFSGDGGPAISAQLWAPTGLALDTAGNLYISDDFNGRIRKVTPSGVITTYAGGGIGYPSGDGGPAVGASLNGPQGLAIDATGNLYIAESASNRVRKVTLAGLISTIAGDGMYGFGGFSGDGGAAAGATLSDPLGVAVGSNGYVYIADYGNDRIRQITPSGIISSVAKVYAEDVTVDSAGNLYIADGGDSLIVKGSLPATFTTIAGNGTYDFSGDGGPASQAQVSAFGLALDSGGNLYITDVSDYVVRKIATNGTNATIATVAGNGTTGFSGDGGLATSAQLGAPTGVAVGAGGNLYIADNYNNRVRMVAPNGNITTVAGTGSIGFGGDGGPAIQAQVWGPFGVAVDSAGNLLISDFENARIRMVAPSGIITTVAGNGTRGFAGDGGQAISAELMTPAGIALDSARNLYIADTNNNRIRMVAANGVITTVAGNGTKAYSGDGGSATSAAISLPQGVAVDAAGNLYIADYGNNRIRKVSSGVITTIAGNGVAGYSGDGGPATSAQMVGPIGVAIDATGNVYVADSTGAIRLLQPVAPTQPTVNASGVVEGAGYRALVAGGGIASLFGTNLAGRTANALAVPLPTALGGVFSLTLGGQAVPLFYVSPNQINFQVPWELSGQAQTSIVVANAAGSSNAQVVSLAAESPGIFTVNSSGNGQGVVTISATGQIATPLTPATRGQYVTIYCSGLGPVSNAPATGAAAPANPLSSTVVSPLVFIDGIPSQAAFSGLVPGLVGLYQVNVLVPTDLAPGVVSLSLQIGDGSSNQVTFAVQ